MSGTADIAGDKPVVSIGDKIKVQWLEDDGNVRPVHAKVTSVRKSSKKKHGTFWKYDLCLYKEDDASVSTRLVNLQWEFRKRTKMDVEVDPPATLSDVTKPKKKKRDHNESTTSSATSIPLALSAKRTVPLESLRHIVAPMVGGSELAFRLLCRKYGATLAYTPMMNSEKFATDAEYRKAEFQTTPEDRPLVAHFSANNPKLFLEAAKLVQDQCDAIDLNLGCPQRIAHSGHFGSYLLDPVDRPLVLDMVRTLANNLRIPIFVKIRLLNTLEESIELCQQLVEAGAGLIAIHARYRVNLVGRNGPGARDGAAHLDQVTAIRKAIDPSVPIIANGNVITWDDVVRNQADTCTQGIMSAEGLLDDPALFNNGVAVDKLALGAEYLDLVAKHPVKLKSVIFHVRRICRDALTQYQLLEDCVAATSVDEVRRIVLQAQHWQTHGNYQQDAAKARAAKEAFERRKYEEGKRKAYEERMMRKAKREGKPLDFYLNLGADPPSEEAVAELRAMSKEERFAVWKAKYPQQCFAFHLESGGCPRDRTCSFLHTDSRVAEAVAYG